MDQAIGKNVANGNTGLIAPNRLVSKDFEEITLDGVTMVFQNAPDTEAPVEMNTYFPQFKALWASELVVGTIHNIYTLRGAAVRNALVAGSDATSAPDALRMDSFMVTFVYGWHPLLEGARRLKSEK